MSNLLTLTTDRKPVDHVLSGAIFAAMTAGGLAYANSKDKSSSQTLKNTLKFTLQGAVASGSAISCANSIAMKNYSKAAIGFAVGLGGVIAIEKLIK